MKKILKLSLLITLVFSSPAVQAGPYVVGGKVVPQKDPVTDSTVGVYSPGPDGRSGALCTGTLIKNDIAVTAAHCIEPGTKPVLIFNRDLRAPGAQRRDSEGVAVNPQWKRKAGRGMDQGDIALVKFDGHLPAGYRAAPVLSKASSLRPGEDVTVAGYGISNAAKKTGAGRLRKTKIRVLDSRPGKSEMILDQRHGHGACHGDSGGPAYVKGRGGIALAGLTNRSYPDSAPDDCAHDVVYTKVPSYRGWIQRNEKRLEKKPVVVRSRGLRCRAKRKPVPTRPRYARR